MSPSRSAPPPSWLGPIAIGSVATLLAQYLMVVLPMVAPFLEVVVPCCCLVEALPLGVLLTAADVFVILWLQGKGFRKLEILVVAHRRIPCRSRPP